MASNITMLVTKVIENKIFDNIYTWGDTLYSIEWAIRASYHFTLKATPGQDVFGI